MSIDLTEETIKKAARDMGWSPAGEDPEEYIRGYEDGLKTGPVEHRRNEAVRAATEVTTAKIAAGDGFQWDGNNVTPHKYMLNICPLIERYLETGDTETPA